MANEPDSPDVRSLVTITLVGTFATIAVSYLVVGLTHNQKLSQQELHGGYTQTEVPVVSEDSQQTVINNYSK